MRIRRGPYVIAQALDEADTAEGFAIRRPFIDLFEDDLPIRERVELRPGEDCLLYDLDYEPAVEAARADAEGSASRSAGEPAILISSSRIRDERHEAGRFTFVSESPANMTVSMRIRLAEAPKRVTADGQEAEYRHDRASGTLLVRHPGRPSGAALAIDY